MNGDYVTQTSQRTKELSQKLDQQLYNYFNATEEEKVLLYNELDITMRELFLFRYADLKMTEEEARQKYEDMRRALCKNSQKAIKNPLDFTVNILSGVLMIAGGALSCAGSLSATAAGTVMRKVGQGSAAAGQGGNSISNVTGNINRANQTGAQDKYETGKERQQKAKDDEDQSKRKISDTIESIKNNENSRHSNTRDMVSR